MSTIKFPVMANKEILKPNETIHAVKQRHTNDLKELRKKYHGKELKKKEQELIQINTNELNTVRRNWEVYRANQEGITLPEVDESLQTQSIYDQLPKEIYKERKLTKTEEERLIREKEEAKEQRQASKMILSGEHEEEIETQKIEEKLKTIHFTGPYITMIGGKIKNIKADGHCLFRALAHQLSLYMPSEQPLLQVPTYETLRKQCETAILTDKKKYSEFLCNQNGEPMSINQVIEYARNIGQCNDNPTWGSHTEIYIISEIYDYPIVIVGSDFQFCVGEGKKNSHLYITFHRKITGSSEHYNSVIPLEID